MFKKTISIMLAVIMIAALCACAKPAGQQANNDPQPVVSQRVDDGQKPENTPAPEQTAAPVGDTTPAPVRETPDPDDEGSYFIPCEGSEAAFDEADPETVLITFTGLVEAGLTAEQLSGMDIYDFSESMGDDTPVFSGPLVSEVLRLAGANDVSVITITFGQGMTMDFMLTDFDLSTAIFAVIKDGKLLENENMFICTTTEGFNYIFSVTEPYELK